jgi:conjugative transposon TraM protein
MPPTSDVNKKKRLLVALGIFALPVMLISLVIFALFHAKKKETTKADGNSAFNTEMPSPNLPKREMNKLEVYAQAEQDSIKRSKEQGNNPDPAASLPQSPASQSPALPGATVAGQGFKNPMDKPGVVNSPFEDPNDKMVTDRLQKLYAALGKGSTTTLGSRETASGPELLPPGSKEIAQLEHLMQEYQKSDTATSPQLNQVKQVLDEIKDIQQPRKPTTGGTQPGPATAIEVTTHPQAGADNDDPAAQPSSPNDFFGLADDPDSSVTTTGTIEAVIHADQIVQSGSIVKLRLLQPVYLGAVQIPANAFIWGPATISGERVAIQLTNVLYDGKIYPINLKVYDGADGLEGLYVPGMITRDVIKQNMAQGVGGLALGSFDQSLGAQAASAGIETAKNLIGRKITIVKATLKAGHVAILRSTDFKH